jgi:hypothetical protein
MPRRVVLVLALVLVLAMAGHHAHPTLVTPAW